MSTARKEIGQKSTTTSIISSLFCSTSLATQVDLDMNKIFFLENMITTRQGALGWTSAFVFLSNVLQHHVLFVFVFALAILHRVDKGFLREWTFVRDHLIDHIGVIVSRFLLVVVVACTKSNE